MSDAGIARTPSYWVWRKSSFSEGNNNVCVEVGRWRKSSFSEPNNNACVEVAYATDAVGVRDSKNADGPRLFVGHTCWLAFVGHLTSTEAQTG